jgi:hypothetical protein
MPFAVGEPTNASLGGGGGGGGGGGVGAGAGGVVGVPPMQTWLVVAPSPARLCEPHSQRSYA